MTSSVTGVLTNHLGHPEQFGYKIEGNGKKGHSLKGLISSIRKLQEDVNVKLTDMIKDAKLESRDEQSDGVSDMENSDEDDEDGNSNTGPVKKKQKCI